MLIKNKLPNICLLLTAIIVTLLLAEAYFRFFYIRTTGMDITLSDQRWLGTYWKPINSFGFRDREYTGAYLKGKHLVFVVGDSFVAGAGIKTIDERFGNLLGKRLGSSYAVLNIAQRGWSTDDEELALSYSPPSMKPEIVILSYYVNDIEDAARRNFAPPPPNIYDLIALSGRNSLFHNIRRKSYLIDFLYWRFYTLTTEGSPGWWQWLKDLYTDPSIWAAHRAELEQFVQDCRSMKAKLLVVIFPNLLDIPGSAGITSQVERFFKQDKVRVLNLAPLLAGRPISQLTVNANDAHPGRWLHAFVADQIEQTLQNAHWTSPRRPIEGSVNGTETMVSHPRPSGSIAAVQVE